MREEIPTVCQKSNISIQSITNRRKNTKLFYILYIGWALLKHIFFLKTSPVFAHLPVESTVVQMTTHQDSDFWSRLAPFTVAPSIFFSYI